MQFKEWRKVMSLNLDAMSHLVKAFLPYMKENRWGRIVSMSSTTFHSGIAMNAHYTASKAALIGMTRVLATELGEYGITVNCIAPRACTHSHHGIRATGTVVRYIGQATGH